MVRIKKICTKSVHIKVVRFDHFTKPIVLGCLFCEPEAVIFTAFSAQIKPCLSYDRES